MNDISFILFVGRTQWEEEKQKQKPNTIPLTAGEMEAP